MPMRANSFVEDGRRRLFRDTDFRKRQKEVEEKIRAKYAKELEAAKNFREWLGVKAKIRREIKESKPSAYAL